MSMRSASLTLTLKELRIAKIDKKIRVNPCTDELESFISALAEFGENKVPEPIARALADCTDKKKTGGARAKSTKFYVNQFVDRKL